MESLLLLIPISMLLLVLAGATFVWAVKRRQFDDLERHALDIFDDQSAPRQTPNGSPENQHTTNRRITPCKP